MIGTQTFDGEDPDPLTSNAMADTGLSDVSVTVPLRSIGRKNGAV
jgi:hypothetical protein